jgi:secondary thiamine-phosphate synthase enzyme
MKVITDFIDISSKGDSDIVDVTPQIEEVLQHSGLTDGHVLVFVSGSTAGVTTIEYEPGLQKDLPVALDKLAPASERYQHDAAWGDGNGHAHVRAALIGASLTVPFKEGRMLLGNWQQIVVVDCDNRPRNRSIVIQMIGE